MKRLAGTRRWGRRAAFVPALVAYAIFAASLSRAQGCSLCRDATAGSAPQARKAFRIAIPLLGIPAIAIFAGGFALARRIQPRQGNEESQP